MALENDPSSRITVKTLGELLPPGHCFLCGNGSFEGNYYDLGVFFDYEGQMYLCATCVIQLGETAGMFTVIEHLEVLTKCTALMNKTAELEEELNNVRTQLDASNTLLSTAFAAGRTAGAVSDESEKPDKDAPESPEAPDDGEPETKEPVPSTGRGDASTSQRSNRAFKVD